MFAMFRCLVFPHDTCLDGEMFWALLWAFIWLPISDCIVKPSCSINEILQGKHSRLIWFFLHVVIMCTHERGNSDNRHFLLLPRIIRLAGSLMGLAMTKMGKTGYMSKITRTQNLGVSRWHSTSCATIGPESCLVEVPRGQGCPSLTA